MTRRGAGFTLVELLVALAITSVLVLLLTNVVSATLTAWQQGRSRLDTYSNARQLIGRIVDEISGAVAMKDRVQFSENDPSLATAPAPAPKPKTSENVFFVAPYPNSGSGDLCVIAYRHDSTSHTLERGFKDSAAAWAPAPANRYKPGGYSGSTAIEWRPVAQGVIEFELQSYSQADIDNATAPADTWNSAKAGDVNMEGKTPRRIVLRIKVVDDRTLTRLATLAPGSAPYDTAVQQSAREFFADFTLPAR